MQDIRDVNEVWLPVDVASAADWIARRRTLSATTATRRQACWRREALAKSNQVTGVDDRCLYPGKTSDRDAIRELIENWAVWRDASMWDRFRTVWHEDGRMMATWFQGTVDEFIAVNKEGYARGVRILHFLGGSSIDIEGPRAIAQTKMTISQRAVVDDVLCDVLCTGRFYDFLEKRKGRWGMVLRQPIYEKDRLDPVDPATSRRSSTGTCWRAFPKAIATSPTCSRGSATTSRRTCRGSTAPWSGRSTLRERNGSQADA